MLLSKRFAKVLAASAVVATAGMSYANTVYISKVDAVYSPNSASHPVVTGGGAATGDANRFHANNVIGQSDKAYYSLDGGWIVVEFGPPAGSLFGSPAVAVEFTNGKSETSVATGTTEKADVYVGTNLSDLTAFANGGFGSVPSTAKLVGQALGSGTSTLNFTGGPYTYMLLRDRSTSSEVNSAFGFDLDSIGVKSVPLPSAVVAGAGLLSVLGAMQLRKRFSR